LKVSRDPYWHSSGTKKQQASGTAGPWLTKS